MLMEWVERFEKEKENKLSKADKMFEELGYTKKSTRTRISWLWDTFN